MPDQRVDLDACPMCDLDPSLAILTDRGAKQTTQNTISAGVVRICFAPETMEVDGEVRPAVLLVHHKEEDPEFVTAADIREANEELQEETTTDEGQEETTTDEGQEGTTEDEEEPEADAKQLDLEDLPEFERAIVRRVSEEGELPDSGIHGHLIGWDRTPDEIDAAIEWLVENGWLYEVEKDTYATVA